MIFYPFIEKTNKYLKSVRILKNYDSYDMIFPTSWVMLKTSPENVEILQDENNEGNIVTSFVCQSNKDFINSLEKIMDNIIRTNIEREEKERLFKMKVKELQNIFEKEKLDSLKSLKFDIEEYNKILSNVTESEPEQTESGV
jgi:hypothetical protein